MNRIYTVLTWLLLKLVHEAAEAYAKATQFDVTAWVEALRLARLRAASAVALALPFGFVVFTTDNTLLALVMLVPPTLLGLMYQAPAFALVQSLATPSMPESPAA